MLEYADARVCVGVPVLAAEDGGIFSKPAQDAAAHAQVDGMATGGALNPPPGQAFTENGHSHPGSASLPLCLLLC
jgi:hypothetical protein